jgi:hypothetical protein
MIDAFFSNILNFVIDNFMKVYLLSSFFWFLMLVIEVLFPFAIVGFFIYILVKAAGKPKVKKEDQGYDK